MESSVEKVMAGGLGGNSIGSDTARIQEGAEGIENYVSGTRTWASYRNRSSLAKVEEMSRANALVVHQDA